MHILNSALANRLPNGNAILKVGLLQPEDRLQEEPSSSTSSSSRAPPSRKDTKPQVLPQAPQAPRSPSYGSRDTPPQQPGPFPAGPVTPGVHQAMVLERGDTPLRPGQVRPLDDGDDLAWQEQARGGYVHEVGWGENLGPPWPTAPRPLYNGFNPDEVQDWVPVRFKAVRKLQDATRNRGTVHLCLDKANGGCLVAIKCMPNRWILRSHSEFVAERPDETEIPWTDIGCTQWLNRLGFKYAVELLGVYRDADCTYVATSFATEGDLFSWCEVGESEGRARDVVVHSLARQMFQAVQQLHDFSIVHRDFSLENVLLCKMDDGSLHVKIIDFSMASSMRIFEASVRGKASYQAPEQHSAGECDGFLTDSFAVGVTLYALLVQDYPWLSTRPGGCKCFEYVRTRGLRGFLAKRKLRNEEQRVCSLLPEPLMQLLEGLLQLDPVQRLTLGERCWAGSGRRSVWDMPWVQNGPG